MPLDQISQPPVDLDEPSVDATEPGKSKSKHKAKAIKTGMGYHVQVPLDSLDDIRISHFDLRLLGLLIVLCGSKRHCWYSEAHLAKLIVGTSGKRGVNLKTISRSVANLVGCEYLRIVLPAELQAEGYTHLTSNNTYVLNYTLR